MAISEEQFKSIIKDMVGKASLKKALENHVVDAHDFFDFAYSDPMYSQDYERAQEARAELLADDIIEIADSDHDPARARNRIDARKWTASKLKPKRFGERLDVNVTQHVDIGGALADARKRAALPSRYQQTEAVAEIVETKALPAQTPTDSESVAPIKPQENQDDDIFQ